jgi:flavin-dependent dehydrogenase
MPRPIDDLIIAGAGTAGLATAIHARLAGLTATVVDPRLSPDAQRTGLDKPCGEGLMPHALERLAAMGVAVQGGVALTGVRYVFGGTSFSGRMPGGDGLGVRRTSLSAALLARAKAFGVQLVQGRIDAVTQHDDHVTAGEHRGAWLIAADGINSRVRAAAGLTADPPRRRRYGVRAYARMAPWSSEVEVHWRREGELYVTPVAPDLVNVALLAAHDMPLPELVAAFQLTISRFGALSPWQGAAQFPQRATLRRAGRLLLVGDAAGFIDPLTGEGNDLALAAAEAAVASIAHNAPQSYERQWLRLTRRYRWTTAALLAVSRYARPAMPLVLGVAPGLMDLGLRCLSGRATHSAGTLLASPHRV